MSKNAQDFIDLAALSPDALRALLDVAHARKAARAGYPKAQADADAPLQNYMLAMVFDKPSTRTRLSFDLAMRQLGGNTMIINRDDTHLHRGESLSDTAQVVSRFADIAMLRTGAHENLAKFAATADIPVINGLTAHSHPCQIVADLMTFEEHKGRLSGQRLAWVGDGNNVAVSLIQAAALLPFELALACPPDFMVAEKLIAGAHKKGAKITLCDTAEMAATGASALMTDCWVSMNDNPATAQKRQAAFAPFKVTQALMDLGDNPIFLHCLPAYRDEEVTAEVIDGAQSVVFDEAENRCHAQKAILLYCLADNVGLADKVQ